MIERREHSVAAALYVANEEFLFGFRKSGIEDRKKERYLFSDIYI